MVGRKRRREELVAMDKGFRLELYMLLQSSAYVLAKGEKGILYKVLVDNGMTPVAVCLLGDDTGPGAGLPERYKFDAEADAIVRVRHTNVARLRADYWSADKKLAVTDFINNGNVGMPPSGKSLALQFAFFPSCYVLELGMARQCAFIGTKKLRNLINWSHLSA